MTSQDTFESDAKAVGERLALLLAAADLPDDVKSGFASMIPEMTPEQIDRLIAILEANVQDTVSSHGKDIAEAIADVQSEYEKKRAEAEKQALTGMNEIENILKQSEG